MHLNTIGIHCGWIYSLLGSVVRTPYSSVTVFGDRFNTAARTVTANLVVCARMMSPVPCAVSTMMLCLLKLMKHRVLWSLFLYGRTSTWMMTYVVTFDARASYRFICKTAPLIFMKFWQNQIKSVLFAQNTSHLNAASGKSS